MTPRERDYVAIALGLLWVDHPFMGDAFDVAFLSACIFRLTFAIFGGRR